MASLPAGNDRDDGVTEAFRDWQRRDPLASKAWIERTEMQRWNDRARRVVDRLQGIRGLRATYALNTAGYGDADLTWDEREVALNRDSLRQALASGEPRVQLEVIITQDRATTVWHATARTRVLRDGEELLVAQRLREVFLGARS